MHATLLRKILVFSVIITGIVLEYDIIPWWAYIVVGIYFALSILQIMDAYKKAE